MKDFDSFDSEGQQLGQEFEIRQSPGYRALSDARLKDLTQPPLPEIYKLQVRIIFISLITLEKIYKLLFVSKIDFKRFDFISRDNN